MNVRDLKLSVACGNASEEVISLNKFFDDLFSGISLYTKDDEPDLIFMKDNMCIIQQDIVRGWLYCKYHGFWSILQDQYQCSYTEIQRIIEYKVEEFFKIDSITANGYNNFRCPNIESYFELSPTKFKPYIFRC